jgi:hypothetical protein
MVEGRTMGRKRIYASPSERQMAYQRRLRAARDAAIAIDDADGALVGQFFAWWKELNRIRKRMEELRDGCPELSRDQKHKEARDLFDEARGYFPDHGAFCEWVEAACSAAAAAYRRT